MKLLFLPFLLLGLMACNPFALDDSSGRDRDAAQGEEDFHLPDIEDIDMSEIKKEALNFSDCANYKNHFCASIFGTVGDFVLPQQKARNCLAKAIDESLKPACEQEQEYRESLDYYERRDNDEAVRQINEALLAIEEQKYDIADELYEIADEFDNIEGDALEEIDEADDEHDSLAQKIGSSLTRVLVKAEFGSFTKCLDAKARLICPNFDLTEAATKRK